MAGEVTFFELGVGEVEGGKAFYGELFGWDFEPGPGDGFAIATGSVPGGLHGGDPGGGPYLFFAVDDLEEALARVEELGGSVVDNVDGDESEVTRFGRFRLCRDDQGSPFGLHEPLRS